MHVRRGSETILLVEEETSVREIIALLLKRLGSRVQEASSGEDGLRLAEGSQEKINLLITDLLMPGMSGRELAQALRARDTSLKVLFLSGHTGNPGVHLGVDALSKKLKEVLDER
jgi:two-component system, cell cycle sensor histidine kinase and response regulator CckA